ncbi:MAG: hypothetical protein AAGA10_24765 [Bacteroidota bacterium]
MELARQLPKEKKMILIQEWLREDGVNASDLQIKDFDEPFRLEEFCIIEEQLKNLQELWKNEPSAEELVQLLTK